jgi:hypothetical protein
MKYLAAWLALSSAYWPVAALLGSAGVGPGAWWALYAVCMLLAMLLVKSRSLALRSGAWLYLAGCAVLLAGLFFGANAGLDVLHGASRPKADVAQQLGGLALWCVLCPGLASVALACAVAGLAAGR